MVERPWVLGTLGLVVIGATVTWCATRPEPRGRMISERYLRHRPLWDLRAQGVDVANNPVLCADFGEDHVCTALVVDAEARPITGPVDVARAPSYEPSTRALCAVDGKRCMTAGKNLVMRLGNHVFFQPDEVADDVSFLFVGTELWSVTRDAVVFDNGSEKNVLRDGDTPPPPRDGALIGTEIVGDEVFGQWYDKPHHHAWWGAMDPWSLAPRGPVRPDGGTAWIAIAPHVSMQMIADRTALRTFDARTGSVHLVALPSLDHPLVQAGIVRTAGTAVPEDVALVLAVDDRGSAHPIWYDVKPDGGIALRSTGDVDLGVVWTPREDPPQTCHLRLRHQVDGGAALLCDGTFCERVTDFSVEDVRRADPARAVEKVDPFIDAVQSGFAMPLDDELRARHRGSLSTVSVGRYTLGYWELESSRETEIIDPISRKGIEVIDAPAVPFGARVVQLTGNELWVIDPIALTRTVTAISVPGADRIGDNPQRFAAQIDDHTLAVSVSSSTDDDPERPTSAPQVVSLVDIDAAGHAVLRSTREVDCWWHGLGGGYPD